LQKNSLRILSIFTLVFFVMSMSGAAATSTTGGKVVETTKLNQINTALHHGPVFLRLGASWCPHCKAFAPTLKELAKEYAGKVTFMSVDIDRSPTLARYFGVSVIPDCSVIVGTKNGKYVYMQQNGKTTTIRSSARITGDKHSISLYRKILNYAIKR
jgi:thiol-disulfide isomerase/thioredoxin